MADDSASAAGGLSARTSRGFAWMLAQTVGSKLAGLVGQVFLARLLLPRDYGLIAICYVATSLPTVLRQTGVPQILVQKGDRFGQWANAAFWMELSMGLLTSLLVLVAAPVAAWAYHTPALAGLMAVIAPSAALGALSSVPSAKLNHDLRFRELALIGAAYNLLAAGLSVFCAWLGFGAYSFVIPLPVCTALRAAAFWWLAPARIRWDLQLHRWWAMAADSGRLMVGGLCYLVQVQADNLALSIWHTKATVGHYFFANNLSGQILQILAFNLGNVLFPVLSTLKDDLARQASAFFRAARALALAGVPICAAEAVLARPVILVVFGVKWLPAVPILQVAALAAAVNLSGSPSSNLIQAQGRFHLGMVWSIVSVVIFTVLVFAGAFLGGPVLVAAGGLVCALLVMPARTLSATRTGGGGAREVLSLFGLPLLLSTAALVPTGLLELFVPWFGGHPVVLLAVAALTATLVYLPLAWRFCPNDMAELARHTGPLSRLLHRAGLGSPGRNR